MREAIARLESEGLVEMAANRYTRVASLSGPAHDQAAMLLAALHAWAIDHAGDAASDARKTAAAAVGKVTAGVDAHDVDAYRGLQWPLSRSIGRRGNDYRPVQSQPRRSNSDIRRTSVEMPHRELRTGATVS